MAVTCLSIDNRPASPRRVGHRPSVHLKNDTMQAAEPGRTFLRGNTYERGKPRTPP